MSVIDTPLGPTEFSSDDDFLTKVRKAVALSGRVSIGATDPHQPVGLTLGPVPMGYKSADMALCEVYVQAAAAQEDFPTFLMTLVDTYASEEDATLFKMFWANRGGQS